MRVIYVDELVVTNLLVDYLLLVVTARIAGTPVRRLRALLAAGVGAVYALTAALSGGRILTSAALKAAVGTAMALTVFGVSAGTVRVTLLFFALSSAFAGAVMAGAMVRGQGIRGAAIGAVSPLTLLLVFGVLYALFTAAFGVLGRRRLVGGTSDLTLTRGGRSVTVTALLDTGNSLRSPFSGKPVTVCALPAVEPLLSKEAVHILRSEGDAARALLRLHEAGESAFFPVPYAAVGRSGGMLVAFRPDSASLSGRALDCAVAIDAAGTVQGQGYSAIVGVQ